MDPKAYRLPTHIRPRHYHLSLNARPDAPTFSGTVVIDVELANPSAILELHSLHLDLSNAEITTSLGSQPALITLDAEREIVQLEPSAPIAAGSATVRLDFHGSINSNLEGLYLAQDGPEEMLCAQTFPTAARTIFPCFDEPTFKAQFAFTITTAPELTVLTNTPLLQVTPASDGLSQTWHFAPSKPLSTYLVAWVIGRLESTPETVINGTPLRVWTLHGKAALGHFAHAYAARLLPWYEHYFDLPYHFAKYDQVAVPGFALGAMETAGLVMFRQNALLLAPTAAWQNEKANAVVIAHEFAHMWFGDLATVAWWDDVWLSEAFAEWLGYKVVDLLSPEYEIWNDFQADKNLALETDALLSTHPVYSPVATSAEAIEMFDAITYLKGCAVLRMLEHFLEAEPFRAGLRGYMREFAERNATSADLWRNLQIVSQQPVATMMETWITQPGYPVVHVKASLNAQQAHLELRQERFFSTPQANAPSQGRWAVPLVIRYADASGSHILRYLLSAETATLDLPLQGALQWCYANAAEIGFYRQHLDPTLLRSLLTHVAALNTSEQMGLLADQWALARNGTQSIGRYLDTLAALLPHPHYSVMAQIVGHLHTLGELLTEAADVAALERFRRWIANAWLPHLDQLGFSPKPGESLAVAQQRAYVVDALANIAKHPEAIKQAAVWAAREALDPAAVDPNLAPVVLNATAYFGDLARFEQYVATYQQRNRASAPPQEQQRYLRSLALFRDPAAINRLLDLITTHVVPQESIVPILMQMLRQPWSQSAAWAYLHTHWATLQSISSGAMPALMEATGHLPARYRDLLIDFYTTHLKGIAHQSYSRALEQIDQRAEFKTRTRADLVAWFQ